MPAVAALVAVVLWGGSFAMTKLALTELSVATLVFGRALLGTSAGVGGSLSPQRVREFDRALAALLARCFPDERLIVPHRVFAVFGNF